MSTWEELHSIEAKLTKINARLRAARLTQSALAEGWRRARVEYGAQLNLLLSTMEKR